MPTKFRTSPAMTIFVIGILFEAKTIAFGGVATGSINAHEADIVAGIIINKG
jgi:hypothetical protein